MLRVDEDALECDFAETYHILDYKALPARKAALFASGLRDDSRIKRKISNQKYSSETILIAAAVDRLSLLLWANSEDGMKNQNRPKLITPQLTGKETPEVEEFESAEDFKEKRRKIIKEKEAGHGNRTGESVCTDRAVSSRN